MRALHVAPLILAAACFGEGPTPGQPADAKVLMALSVGGAFSCGTGHYLGGVSIGGVYGYAVVQPFQKMDNCDNGDMGGTTPPSEPAAVWQFALDGSEPPQQVATAGVSDGTHNPRVQATGAGVNFVYQVVGSTRLDVGGVPPIMYQIQYTSGDYLPAGLTRDASREMIYVAGHAYPNQSNSGKAEPNNPNYPCCGVPAGVGGSEGFIYQIASDGQVTKVAPVPKFACEYSGRCFTGNTDSLIYLAHGANGTGFYVGLYPKDGGQEQILAALDGLNSTAPVGLIATDTVVGWAIAPTYDNTTGGSSASTLPKHCEIGVYDLVAHSIVQPSILNTNRFTCTGVSTDGEFIYFAIVEFTERQHYHGLGIGRVNIATRAVETIAVSVAGGTSGVRRLFITDTDMYLVDPFAVVRVPKTALDGKHDILP